MAEGDRKHWDERYRRYGPAPADELGPPPLFQPYTDLFPTVGFALELGCGRGRGAVWLASRGLEVLAVDVSPVAVQMGCDLAVAAGVGRRCHFEVADLDAGLPFGPSVEVVLSYMFRDPRLDEAIMNRLGPGGLLAIAGLSEVDVGPGRFRAPRGELLAAFRDLDLVDAGERAGQAWLLGRRRP